MISLWYLRQAGRVDSFREHISPLEYQGYLYGQRRVA